MEKYIKAIKKLVKIIEQNPYDDEIFCSVSYED